MYISAKTGEGKEGLEKAVMELTGAKRLDENSLAVINMRQRRCAESALVAVNASIEGVVSGVTYDMVEMSLEEAVGYMMELDGEKASEGIVNEIFSKFCVGK